MIRVNTEGKYCGRRHMCIVMVEDKILTKDVEKLWIIRADDRKEDKVDGYWRYRKESVD